jgi:1-acyl-sn-glycerol-3-phosphate acyltransferase
MARVFYARLEVEHANRVPREGPLVLCANHASALADAVIVQAASPRALRFLAKSTLFESPVFGPILRGLGAVPIFRAQDHAGDTRGNQDSFARCYELLHHGEALLIFPEGQSHSDPHLRPLKTGAARLALGTRERHGTTPLLVPLGLTFTAKGRFRSSVLVEFGTPLEPGPDEDPRALTDRLEAALAAVTLNAGDWDEVELARLLRRFFALGRRGLGERRRALQRLLDSYRALAASHPLDVRRLRRRLQAYERLTERLGVHDHHLTLRYRPAVLVRFAVRATLFALVAAPLAAAGFFLSGPPYVVTDALVRRFAGERDQADTANMLAGLCVFSLAWGAWTFLAWRWVGLRGALGMAVALPATGLAALYAAREWDRLREDLRVWALFARRRSLRALLLERRRELEASIMRLLQRARSVREQAAPPPPTPTIPPRP